MPPVATQKIAMFEPALLSIAELEFLRDHLGESPTVALSDGVPESVNPIEIERHLTMFKQFEELEAHRGQKWAGYDQIKDSIERFLDWHDKTRAIQAQGGPRHPSQFTWDSQGNVYRSGISSDSDMVRHEITDEGERVPFAVRLNQKKTDKDAKALMPWIGVETAKTRKLDEIDEPAPGVMVCSVCQHNVSFNVKGGKGAKNRALGHMARHLKTAKSEQARHIALYNRKFR